MQIQNIFEKKQGGFRMVDKKFAQQFQRIHQHIDKNAQKKMFPSENKVHKNGQKQKEGHFA